MKKMLVAFVLFGMMIFGCGFNQTEAAELHTQQACDGCIVFTIQSLDDFVTQNRGKTTGDPRYKATIMHFQHVMFTCKCGNQCWNCKMGVYNSK